MQNSQLQQPDQADLFDINSANMTEPEYDGAEPNHPRFLTGYGAQCTSVLQCDGVNDCCFGLQTSSGFGRCYPSCNSSYQSTCSNGKCAVGLICRNGHCVYAQQTTLAHGVAHGNPQSQLAVLTKELKHQYHANQNYVPTNAAAERAREYELHQQAALLQKIETSQYGEIDYAFVNAKLQEIEQEKIRLELEQQKKTVEQAAVKQEYLNEVRKEQAKIAHEVNNLQMQQGMLNKQEHVVAGGHVPPGNKGSAGYGVSTGTNVHHGTAYGTAYPYGKGVYPHGTTVVPQVGVHGAHVTNYGAHGYGYNSGVHGVHGNSYNPNNQFYDRLRAAVNVQPSYTYLNTEDSSSSDEIAGIPVGGFIGIIVGVLVLCLVAVCLVRYIFFPRKFQTPEDMDPDNVDYGMGDQSDGYGGQSMSNMSPRIDHMKGANADVFASNTSMDPKIPGQQN